MPQTSVTMRTLGFCYAKSPAHSDLLAHILGTALREPFLT